jgi:hypothetical protein
MVDLIQLNTQIALTDQLKDEPFAYLFFSHLPANLPLTGKTQYLKEFCVALSKLESHAENNLTRNHWLCITSGFSAAITVAGSNALFPLGGMILSGAAVVAAVTVIVEAVATKNQVEAIVEELKRHRLALESQQSIQWAALWQFAESDLFCRALAYASRGFVSEGRLMTRGDDTPFQRAIDFVAECRGLRYIEVVEGARAIMNESPSVPVSVDKPRLNPVSLEQEETLAPKPVEQKPTVSDDRISPVSPVNEKPINPLAAPVNPPHGSLTSGQAGLEILQALATSRRSTLLIGDTGAGKSVTQAYILNKLFELHPDAQVFGISQKADSFCGLAEQGRVTLFDPTEPEQALFLIHSIWLIYDQRRRLPESDRPGLPPVRLILADWLSINQSLDELKNDETVKASRYLSKLADIIYNGRELNVCLLVDLQSYNLAAVGLKADRNSRKNFNLIGLGNYSVDELGMVNESYGVLTNLIGDRYIVSDESERAALSATFKQLQPISKQHRRPIIFSSLSPARLALLPDLRSFKTSKVAATSQVTTPSTLAEEEAIPSNPASLNASSEPTSDLKVSDVLADSLAEPLKTIWLFAKERNDWVTVRDIQRRTFAVLKDKSSEQIHRYLGLLADTGYGEIDEEGKSHSSVGFKAH